MASDMFIKIGSFAGESDGKGHEGWTDVLAWSWGGSQSGTASVGGGMGGGKVSMSNFSITKYTDISSPKYWLAMSKGDHIGKCEFHAQKAGGTPFLYLKITLHDCIITSLSTGGSGGEDRTTENMSIDFKKYELFYDKQAKGGGSDGDDTVIFDISANVEG